MGPLADALFFAWQVSGWGGQAQLLHWIKKEQVQPVDLSTCPGIAPLLEYGTYNTITVAVGERETPISILAPSRLQNHCPSLMVCQHHYHRRQQQQ